MRENDSKATPDPLSERLSSCADLFDRETGEEGAPYAALLREAKECIDQLQKRLADETEAHFEAHPSGWVLVEFEPGTMGGGHQALRCGNPGQAERGIATKGMVRWWFADRRCIPCDGPNMNSAAEER